jgi:hypothetical protein
VITPALASTRNQPFAVFYLEPPTYYWQQAKRVDQLVNVHAEGDILTGNVIGSNGEQLPGGWEMKLTSDTEAESHRQ